MKKTNKTGRNGRLAKRENPMGGERRLNRKKPGVRAVKLALLAALGVGLAAWLAVILIGGGEGPRTACGRKTALKCGAYDVAIEAFGGSGRLNASINGEKIVMENVVSASGAKYAGRGAAIEATLWSKGSDWSLILGNGPMIPCKPAKK